MSTAWKSAEKEVAEFFDGVRRVRVNYSDKVGDIFHPVYSIEVKYGRQIPKYLTASIPLILNGTYKLFPARFATKWGKEIRCASRFHPFEKKSTKFLDDAMEQARSYNPTLIPVVCVKPYRYSGFVIVMER